MTQHHTAVSLWAAQTSSRLRICTFFHNILVHCLPSHHSLSFCPNLGASLWPWPLFVVFSCDPRLGNRNCDRIAHTEMAGLATKNSDATCLSICNPFFILLKFACTHTWKSLLPPFLFLQIGSFESAQTAQTSSKMGSCTFFNRSVSHCLKL